MARIIGYLKPDMNGHNVQSQLAQLNAAGVTEIRQETSAGIQRNMPTLDKLLADVQAGDTLVVTSLDRMALNTKHLLGIVESLNAAGAALKVIDSGIDTSTPQGEVIRKVLAALADLDWQVVRERQSAGIAKAKQEGRYKGRKPTARAKTDDVLALNSQGLTRQKIADQLGIGVASVYRILKNQATLQNENKKTVKKPVVKQRQGQNKPTRETTGEHHAEQLSLF